MGSLSDQFRPPPEVEWYVAIAGQQHGPMPIERVRELVQEGQLSEGDLVWNENLTEWQEASGVPAIDFSLLNPHPLSRHHYRMRVLRQFRRYHRCLRPPSSLRLKSHLPI